MKDNDNVNLSCKLVLDLTCAPSRNGYGDIGSISMEQLDKVERFIYSELKELFSYLGVNDGSVVKVVTTKQTPYPHPALSVHVEIEDTQPREQLCYDKEVPQLESDVE